jgi:hypothetical protein
MIPTRRRATLAAALLWLAAATLTCPASADDSSASAGGSGFDGWFATSDAAKESQPHWITPVVTVTPRLEQEYRYDQSSQARPNNVTLDNYGLGKGFELIPTLNTELIVGVPAYQVRTNAAGRTTGWADETFLIKYRFAAENEEHGNYIVTGFLGVSLPSGSSAFTNKYTIVTPTIAAGKGWGTRTAGFDIQTTLGVAVPTVGLAALGMPVTWNTALQAHVGRLWPELETTYTYYRNGPNDGKSQLALTAGLVVGRFELSHRARLIIGGGFQKVVSSFKTTEHTWLLTARVAF